MSEILYNSEPISTQTLAMWSLKNLHEHCPVYWLTLSLCLHHSLLLWAQEYCRNLDPFFYLFFLKMAVFILHVAMTASLLCNSVLRGRHAYPTHEHRGMSTELYLFIWNVKRTCATDGACAMQWLDYPCFLTLSQCLRCWKTGRKQILTYAHAQCAW
jgi:hypothetical protein